MASVSFGAFGAAFPARWRAILAVAPLLALTILPTPSFAQRGGPLNPITPPNPDAARNPIAARGAKRRPVAARATRLGAISAPDPVLGLTLHTVERGLLRRGGDGRGSGGGLSDLDRAFDRTLARRRVSPAALAMLQKAVANFRALPPAVQGRIVPPQIASLDVSQPISAATATTLFKTSLQGTVKAGNMTVDPKLLSLLPPDPNPDVQSNLSGLKPAAANYSSGQVVMLQGSNFLKRDDVTVAVVLYEKTETAIIGRNQSRPGFRLAGWQSAKLQSAELQNADFQPARRTHGLQPVMFRQGFSVKYTFVARLTPTSIKGRELRVTLPALKPGQLYSLEVEQTFKGQKKVSPKFDFNGPAPDAPPPVPPAVLSRPEISGFSPASAFPGQTVTIEGTNLGVAKMVQGSKVGTFPVSITVELTPPDDVGLPAQFFTGTVVAPSVNGGPGQIKFQLPKTLIPGAYSVQLRSSPQGIILSGMSYEGGAVSLSKPFEVRAHRYTINFLRMWCDDESDPEYAGGDELVTTWFSNVDGVGFAKNSREYTEHGDGFDDGNDEFYDGADRKVFPLTDAGEVRVALALSTTLFEWDAGDVKSAQEALGVVSDIANGVAAYAVSSGALPAAAIAAAVSAAAKVASKIVALFDDGPDFLGQQDMGWTAQQLLALTDNPAKKMTGVLQFKNSDDDGSYHLDYEINRND